MSAGFAPRKICLQFDEMLVASLRPPIFDGDGAVLDPIEFA